MRGRLLKQLSQGSPEKPRRQEKRWILRQETNDGYSDRRGLRAAEVSRIAFIFEEIRFPFPAKRDLLGDVQQERHRVTLGRNLSLRERRVPQLHRGGRPEKAYDAVESAREERRAAEVRYLVADDAQQLPWPRDLVHRHPSRVRLVVDLWPGNYQATTRTGGCARYLEAADLADHNQGDEASV